MESKVEVSVLITAFNEQTKIERCLKSILSQTFQGFEIILINDGSTDQTDEVIRRFIEEHDINKKIRYYSRENKGRIASLNEGLNRAKGEYIAIQDADDYSKPSRLEKQIAFFKANPEVDILGSSYIRLDGIRGETYVREYPTEDKQIKREMCKYIPLCQGSVMARTDIIRSVGGYNEECKDAEDLDLWLRIGKRATFANLKEPLYVYDLSLESSYFHKSYTIRARNRRLAKLNCKAVKVFDLPRRNYVYPLARLVYPYIPNGVKTIVRGKVSQISERQV